jgi:hypothetical protein
MGRPKLAAAARRIRVDVTLSQAALSVLEALVQGGHAATRSAAVEAAVMAWKPRKAKP